MKETVEKKAASILSVVFHPLFIPLMGILLLMNLNNYFAYPITLKEKLIVIALVVLSTIILPIIFIAFLKFKKIIASFQLHNREERTLPYLFSSLLLYFCYYILNKSYISDVYIIFLLGANLLLIITLLINFWWKISIHMIAIGGLLGTIVGLALRLHLSLVLLVVIIFLISGLVGFARLKQNSHNPPQVYGGFLVGALFMYLLFLNI